MQMPPQFPGLRVGTSLAQGGVGGLGARLTAAPCGPGRSMGCWEVRRDAPSAAASSAASSSAASASSTMRASPTYDAMDGGSEAASEVGAAAAAAGGAFVIEDAALLRDLASLLQDEPDF
jgi:hypothetical protein